MFKNNGVLLRKNFKKRNVLLNGVAKSETSSCFFLKKNNYFLVLRKKKFLEKISFFFFFLKIKRLLKKGYIFFFFFKKNQTLSFKNKNSRMGKGKGKPKRFFFFNKKNIPTLSIEGSSFIRVKNSFLFLKKKNGGFRLYQCLISVHISSSKKEKIKNFFFLKHFFCL